MNDGRIVLNVDDIVNKNFSKVQRGYRIKEVNQFLNIVIEDYEEFGKMLKEDMRKKEDLLDMISKLKEERDALKNNIDSSNNDVREGREVTNLDIIKRISQLEKVVYGKKDNN